MKEPFTEQELALADQVADDDVLGYLDSLLATSIAPEQEFRWLVDEVRLRLSKGKPHIVANIPKLHNPSVEDELHALFAYSLIVVTRPAAMRLVLLSYLVRVEKQRGSFRQAQLNSGHGRPASTARLRRMARLRSSRMPRWR